MQAKSSSLNNEFTVSDRGTPIKNKLYTFISVQIILTFSLFSEFLFFQMDVVKVKVDTKIY